MKKGVIILMFCIFSLLTVLSGCSRFITPVCNSPYILVGTACCLDMDDNSICDSDDKQIEKEAMKSIRREPEVAEVEKNLTEAPAEEVAEEAPKLSVDDALDSVVIVEMYANGDLVSSGSGFFVDKDGFILTNRHVVDSWKMFQIPEWESSFKIKTRDNQYYEAEVVDWNWDYDIALLRLKSPDREFAYLNFSDSYDINIGDTIFVLGSPEGLEFSSARGSVSAVSRPGLTNEDILDYIQIDAPLNEGNSGGPVIDEDGHVIGIATYGYASWYTEGLYFALESNAAMKLLDVMERVKSAIPDATLPECRMGKGSYRKARSNYDVINYQKDIRGAKPQLNIFFSDAESKISFNSMAVPWESDIQLSYGVCFRFKVMSDASVIFSKIVGEPFWVSNPKTVASIPVKIDFVTDYTPGWYYYELTAFDCDTKKTLYQFYRRDFYDSEFVTGDSAVFEQC